VGNWAGLVQTKKANIYKKYLYFDDENTVRIDYQNVAKKSQKRLINYSKSFSKRIQEMQK